MLTTIPLTTLSASSTSGDGSNPVHRIFAIDCSGSMACDLDQIRTHLKNKVPSIIRPTDFLTVVWFSGRNECGTVLEHVSITDLQDLSAFHRAVEQYLHTVGSTGFIDPIRLCRVLADKYTETPQVFFLTDGGENSYDHNECKQAFRDVGEGGDVSIIIVEYGYHADRAFLTELADCSGATLIFNEDFGKYSTSFDSYLVNRVVTDRYAPFESKNPVIYFQDDAMKIVKVKNNGNNGNQTTGPIRLPLTVFKAWEVDETKDVGFISNDDRTEMKENVKDVYIAMLYGLETRNQTVMRKCTEALGDIYLTKKYSVCFSRQDYVYLTEYVMGCIVSPHSYPTSTTGAFREGFDPDFHVKDDCFTVIKLLDLLVSDPSTRFFPFDPVFVHQYRRISKEAKREYPLFFPNEKLGAPVSIIYHQSRANMSLGCRVHGHSVTETDEVTSTTAYRNYSIVKDGIKNVKTIPASISEAVYRHLVTEGCIGYPLYTPATEQYVRGKVYLIDISNLPVVNRAYASAKVDSQTFCKLHLRLHHLKTEMKYLSYRKKILDEENKDENKDENKENNDEKTEYKKAEKRDDSVRDFYNAPELQVKIKGCSTIPPVNNKLFDKLSAGESSTLTPSEQFYRKIHTEYTWATDVSHDAGWIYTKIKDVAKDITEIVSTLEEMKTAILIAGVWFSADLDEHTFTVEYENSTYSVSVETNDIKVYLD